MKTILIVDRNRRTCSEIRSVLTNRHKVVSVHTVLAAIKSLNKRTVDVVLVKTAARDQDAISLLQALKKYSSSASIVVLVGAGSSGDVAKVRNLGANAILRWPTTRKRLFEAVASPGNTKASGIGAISMVSTDERQMDVARLKQRLNHYMKCSEGKNKVYLRSVSVGNGITVKQRVSLRCPLRADIGLVADIFYEDIRDRCCDNPDSCPAVIIFRRRQRESNHSVRTRYNTKPIHQNYNYHLDPKDCEEVGFRTDLAG